MTLWLMLGGLVLLAAVLMVVVIIKKARRRLNGAATKRIRSMIERADRAGEPVLRVLEYDKVLDHLLLELGFTGTTGQKMIKGAARFSNKQALWKCHKLRNLVAHEHGATVSASEADHFKRVLEKALLEVSSRS